MENGMTNEIATEPPSRSFVLRCCEGLVETNFGAC